MLAGRELLLQDLKKVQQASLEEEYRLAARIAHDNYNQALAADRAQKLKEQQRREEQENLAEVWHTLTSDMMTECAEAAERAAGGGRPPGVLTDRWKGMTREQLNAIHREREASALRDRYWSHWGPQQRDAEKNQEAAWNLHLLKLSKQVEEEEMRAAKLRRDKRLQMDQINMHLAKEQQAYQEYLNKKLYTNKPTKDFFSQFNTTSR
ncbi:hypothetical protein Q5P01_007645 [Channa striata]|uniref:RIB43A-like with coiled-coils protein 1 n=1 Tax=Channa striata TaxID=64152 RepID=A0AA88N400_CHASR|nr:hypothetical protein Q5P01_007645 [Channa striata]